MVFSLELNENAVEFLQLPRGTVGLQGHGIVGQRRGDFDVVSQASAELQVEVGVKREVLVVAETKSAGVGAGGHKA